MGWVLVACTYVLPLLLDCGAGVPWRLGRHIAAVFILDKARVELAPVLFPAKFE